MPVATSWRGWPVAAIRDEFNAYYRNSEFLDSSIFQRRIDSITRRSNLNKGICWGACIKWCRRLFDHPDEKPIDRMGHLVADLHGAAAVQFLHDETYRYQYALETGEHTEFLDSLCRVSRLKFDLAYDVQHPSEPGGRSQLDALIDSSGKGIYCLLFGGFYQSPGGNASPCAVGHCMGLVIRESQRTSCLDTNFGEFVLDPDRLSHFLNDYLKVQTVLGHHYNHLWVYHVQQLPKGLPFQDSVQAGPPIHIPSPPPPPPPSPI